MTIIWLFNRKYTKIPSTWNNVYIYVNAIKSKSATKSKTLIWLWIKRKPNRSIRRLCTWLYNHQSGLFTTALLANIECKILAFHVHINWTHCDVNQAKYISVVNKKSIQISFAKNNPFISMVHIGKIEMPLSTQIIYVGGRFKWADH